MPPKKNPPTPQEQLFRTWLDVAMPHRQGTELGKVESAACDGDGYRCSVSLLNPATLEETSENLADIPINTSGGFWTLPAAGQLVAIGFLGLNRSFPFVMGCYSEGAENPSLQAGELLLGRENGPHLKIDSAGLIALSNQNESLKALLMALIDDLSALKTIPASPGSPLTLAPTDIAKIQSYKGRLSALLGD
ncbi:MAG: hypothetical protein AAF975_00115 [Spirochaetota bacterium]